MQDSGIKQLWKGAKSLKRVELGGCRSLIKTPDFTKVPSLEILSLSNCRSLSQVHQSIGVLKRLKELDLSNCEKLKSLPDLISLKSLEQLDLRHCLELEKFPEIVGNLTSLWWPDLEETLLKELPSSGLFTLDLSGCQKPSTLPSAIFSQPYIKELRLDGCPCLEEFPDLSGLKYLAQFTARDTAITQLTSPNLLPKNFIWIQVSGRIDLPAESKESCIDDCGFSEESSDPFRVSCLWFNNSPGEFAYSGRIRHGSEEIICRRNFLEGLCINYDSEKGGDILYFGLGDTCLDGTLEQQRIHRCRNGSGIFDFLLTGASSLAATGIPEWFNNITSTCSSVTIQGPCEESLSAKWSEQIMSGACLSNSVPLDMSREWKGCSLFFVYKEHGPAWDKGMFFPWFNFLIRTLGCVFESNEGLRTKPLFICAHKVPDVVPIGFWAPSSLITFFFFFDKPSLITFEV